MLNCAELCVFYIKQHWHCRRLPEQLKEWNGKASKWCMWIMRWGRGTLCEIFAVHLRLRFSGMGGRGRIHSSDIWTENESGAPSQVGARKWARPRWSCHLPFYRDKSECCNVANCHTTILQNPILGKSLLWYAVNCHFHSAILFWEKVFCAMLPINSLHQ